MATIGKIRKRSGLLIAIIGAALLAFILGDLLSNRRGGGHKDSTPLSVVFGEKIKYEDFAKKVELRKAQYMMQYGQNMKFLGNDLFQINNEVYEKMVEDIILSEEYDKLGLALGDAEITDMFTGYFINPIVKQLFTNPQTGVFDRAQVANFIENLDQQNPEMQQNWQMYEDMIIEERIKQKYINLINKGFYFPKAFVDREIKNKNTKFTTAYTGIRYSTINDSAVTVTEEDMKNYFNSHKYDFMNDEIMASVDFVIFDVRPSENDMKVAQDRIDSSYSNLNKIDKKDIRFFVNQNSDMDYTWDTSFVGREKLPVKADTLFGAQIGASVAPYLDNNVFYIHKIIDRKMMPDSMKAAHILISYQGALRADSGVVRTKEDAKKTADSLLLALRGKDSTAFAKVAIEYSNDPSAQQNGGFLGWFHEGSMVPEFNNACLNFPNGSYVVVGTDFGYHIIKVLDRTKPKNKVKLATIKQTVLPSKITLDSIYNVANVFAAESQTSETFDKSVEEKSINKRVADRVRTTDYTLPGIEEGREVVRWAFKKETEVGKTSPVFTLDGETKYVVAVLKNKFEKGIAKFESVKKQLEPYAKREKKAQMIIEKMQTAINGAKTIEEIAQKLSTQIDTFDVAFTSYSLPGYGPEQAIIGSMTVAQKGKISNPIQGESSVMVYVVLDSQETLAELEDTNAIKMQKQQFFQSKVNYELFKSLQKIAKIKDNRILFF